MFRQILPTFFLFMFVCCQLCGQGCAGEYEQTSDTINENTFSEFLKPKDKKLNEVINKAIGEDERQNGIKGIQIESVFLAAANGVVVVLAEVDYSVNNKKKFIIVEKVIETDIEKWKNEVVENDGNDWKTQLVTKNDKNIEEKAKFKSSAVVGNGNKIYYFSINNSKFENGIGAVAAQTEELHITVVVGEVANQEKKITWNSWDLKNIYKGSVNLNEKLKTDLGTPRPAVGFGFVIEDKIVFAIQGEANDQSDGKYVTVFFQLDDQKVEELFVKPTGNCYFSLFLWKGQIVMIPSVCLNGEKSNQEIKVFDYKKRQFNKSDRSFARLQEFLKDKKDFVTAKIDTKIGIPTDVLLFTQQTEETESSKDHEKHKVYLWITDGSRTAKVDTIITGNKGKFDVSMLHVNNELFVLYNNYGTGGGVSEDKYKYNLKRLPNQLNKIKSVLEAWKDTKNDKIKKLFEETAPADTSSFTNGLVGFLAGDSQNDDYWKDEFFYENAKVTPTEGERKPTKVLGGFAFSGVGAGAKWPVGKSKENQPYNFANPGFTLVATVKIDKDTNKERKNSILGIGLEGNSEQKKKLLGCGAKMGNGV